MSDSAIYATVASYEKKSGKTKALKVLVIILSIILCLEAVFYVFVLPCFRSVKISYSGVKTLSDEQLYSASGEEINKPWLKFDPLVLASGLSAYPSVESVVVEKRFPDQVLVQVIERTPVAATLLNIDGKTETVLIDKGGVLFGTHRNIESDNIPLVTGLVLDSLSEGSRLHPKLRTLMEQISEIQKKSPVYLSVISEIRVLPKIYGDYELMLYPIHSHTRVLTDRTLNEDSLQYMMVVLDVIDSIDSNVQEVDLRHGSVSYKTSGGKK
jgi:cell division protein FtsQ